MSRRSQQPDPVVELIPGKPDRVSGGRLIELIDKELRVLRKLPVLSAHGNRQLQADHIVIAHLVGFFNPLVKSLRRIEDVFQSPKARQRFGLPRVPRSTLADAQAMFDPSLLVPLIESLKARLPTLPLDPRLDEVTRQLLAVDGTFFAMAPRIAWAVHHKYNNPQAADHKGHVRVDIHFDLRHGVPHQAFLSGEAISEQDALARHLRKGCLYLLDRGFQAYALLADIIEAGSDFVVRVRQDQAFEILKERSLSADDRLAGVVRDAEIRIQGHRARKGLGAQHVIRRVEIRRPDRPEPIVLLTNRLDLEAELIGLLYRHRWQIELFFRWLKCMANFQHFYSESQAGVTLQVYAALIGTLLIAVQTGSKPNVYTYSLMNHVISGLIDPDEAPAIIARRLAICARDAERARARRAEQARARGASKKSAR